MPLEVGRPVVCPAIIGRDAPLAALDAALNETRAGTGATVLLHGEAGIGKSRLVAEARARASRLGMTTLAGYCYETDRARPYAPFLDLLRSRLARRTPDEVARELAPVPELARLLPELGLPEATGPISPDPEQEKRRLYQAFARYLADRAADRPLLVAIEDLHWSDDSSLDLLLAVARRLTDAPILLLLTYRSDEVDERLGHFLASLDRERLARELSLRRLPPTDVDAMLRAILDLPHATPSGALQVLHTLTDGNPFFVEECLKALLAGGDLIPTATGWRSTPPEDWQVPRTVQEAVQRRTRQLSPEANRVLGIAAVIGQRCDFALLQDVAGLDEGTLLAQLKELVAAQLLVEEEPDRFAFRHALTRQAISTRLLGRERRSLHRAVFTAIERLYLPDLDRHASSLAYHAFAAAAWAQAQDYATRAAWQAQALRAPRAVVEHCTRALEAARHGGATPPGALQLLRGEAHEALGDFDEARDDYEAALGAARDAGDRHGEWRALLDLGVLWAAKDYARAGEYFRRALDLARALGEPLDLARSLNRLGNWQVNTGQVTGGIANHREALAIFEEHGDIAGQVETLDLLGMAHAFEGDLAATGEYAMQANALWPAIGDHPGWVSSLVNYANSGESTATATTYSLLHPPGRYEQYLNQALAVARRLEWPAGEAWVHAACGTGFATYGQFSRGLAHGSEALRIATEIGHQQWAAATQTFIGWIYSRMLAPERALPHLEDAHSLARELGSTWWTGFSGGYLALTYLQTGALDRAAALLAGLEPRGRAPQGTPERHIAWARGELALAQGDATTALAIADQLLDSLPGQRRDQPIPWLLRLRGRALLALGSADEALTVLEGAKRGAEQRQELSLLWQVRRTLGEVHQRARHRDRAAAEFAAARALVADLAATIDDAPLREGFLAAALATFPPDRAPTSLRAAKAAAGGLTARERAVAALIAEGKSNRAIAEALVIGEPTVATHVSHILGKLGATSRAQVAAWVRERGAG